ncbi:MAG TPA: carboxypeptidase regulatory-like domain-containing protein [Flavipsychrobacter sp.]
MSLVKKSILFAACALLAQYHAAAQTETIEQTITPTKVLKQNVRGRVIDAESKQPMVGVVVVLQSNNTLNAITDDNGYFTISNVPVGRQSFIFQMAGFDTYTASEVMVISGKELELNASMVESLHKLDEVTVSANKDRVRPLNEFAAISARSFSVEETRRYAASFADPARMVMNFPGVSNGGDMDNGVVVRGNSPKGVLWKLEGIEIPNPNHFAGLGATGGAISMLNANTLGTSDFYTGAFVPEIGNALSGAFDLNLRNGNSERYEHTVQIGTLGAEIATEGPFKKGSKASYILNYRYSTLAILEPFIKLGGMIPKYQDGSFKVNLPTKKAGTFTLFGLGGHNVAAQNAVADSSKWFKDEENDENNVSYNNKGTMAVAGLSHQYFLNKDAYIKTIISGSTDRSIQSADTLNPGDAYKEVPVQNSTLKNTALRVSVMYNQKLSARNTIRAGVIGQQWAYDFSMRIYYSNEKQWKDLLSSDGNTQFYQGYVQWKSRVTDKITTVAGMHASYLALNGKYTVEPRASATYQMRKSKVTLAAGLHSKPEHISTYFYQNAVVGDNITHPNKNLDMQRAFHTVAGYEISLPLKLRLKLEAYYQYLYDVPVEKDSSSAFSIINANDIYSLMRTKKELVNDGTGRNYGIDISLERPFANNYYVIATGSVFNSTFTTYKGERYSTQYNRGYQMNLIGGKEFKLSANGRRVIGLNGKVLYSGGLRESPIDLQKSIQSKEMEAVPGLYYTKQAPAYFRADATLYYKINNKRATHTIQFEVQNLTNRENYYFSYYDDRTQSIKRVNQLGILPNLSYRIDFHW